MRGESFDYAGELDFPGVTSFSPIFKFFWILNIKGTMISSTLEVLS